MDSVTLRICVMTLMTCVVTHMTCMVTLTSSTLLWGKWGTGQRLGQPNGHSSGLPQSSPVPWVLESQCLNWPHIAENTDIYFYCTGTYRSKYTLSISSFRQNCIWSPFSKEK